MQASRDGQAVCGGDVERVVNGDGRGYVVRGQVRASGRYGEVFQLMEAAAKYMAGVFLLELLRLSCYPGFCEILQKGTQGARNTPTETNTERRPTPKPNTDQPEQDERKESSERVLRGAGQANAGQPNPRQKPVKRHESQRPRPRERTRVRSLATL